MNVSLFVLCLLLTFQTYAQTQADSLRKSKLKAMVGKPFPDFDLTSIDGKNYKLADLKGKVVVLNFWFIECYPCLAEFPDLNKVVKNFEGKEVVFLALCAKGKIEKIRTLLKRRPIDYEVITSDFVYAKTLGVEIFPVNMVINTEGYLVYAEESYQEAIQEILTNKINEAFTK